MGRDYEEGEPVPDPLPVGAAKESTLSALNGKFTDLDAGGRQPVTTHPVGELDVAQGIVFGVGGVISLGAGQQGAIVIENPADSGKNFIIRFIDCYIDVNTGLDIDFIEDPNVSGGTVLTPVNHDFGSATSTVAVATAGQGITSGGTELHLEGRVARNAPYHISDAIFILPEGKSLALRVTAPGGLTGGAVFEPNISWAEVDP